MSEYGCEVLFDSDTASRMRDLIEEATGGLCPCKTGRGCPLVVAATAEQKNADEAA